MNLFQRKKLHMIGERSGSLEQARGRIVLMSAVFVCAYLLVAARSVDLMVLQGALQKKGEDAVYVAPIKDEKISRRGDIVDRNGVLLARSLKTASLYADPKFVIDPKTVTKELTKVFPDLQYGDVLKKLQSKKRFVWIKRNLTPEEQGEVLQLGIPALDFKEEDRRLYPQGPLAVHMVGYSGVDGQGLSGIEASFNELLENDDDALTLTIDVRLQHALRREIMASIEKFSAKGGAGVIMDVRDGSVLAAVSLPDFDPQQYKSADNNAQFNRITLGVYELGSVFKIFSTAALLETTNGNIAQVFDAREPLKRGRHKIRDYHAEKRIMSLPEVFMHSSNIGSALMGEQVGTEKLKNFYKDLGLLTNVNFEIGEVGRPIVPSPWRDINTLTACYGHGVAVSPLQLTSAVSSIVNGGEYVEPTLILNEANSEKVTKKSSNKTSVRIVSPEVSHRMRQLLRLVVTDGTGRSADVEGYYVGGKTGTAEKPGVGGYNRKSLISSFVGTFPVQEPRYVVYVMVDEPQGTKESYGYATGGWVAAPVVKNVISSMVSILNIPLPSKPKNIEKSLLRFVKTKEQIEKEKNIATH
ncbi:MAG: penicillin-binding protein [Micavibrio sp.]|nr:penicillin-binding protein [Micavibrio sp.]